MVSSEHEQLCARLTGALIGLARAVDGSEHLISEASTRLIVEGLAATAPNGATDADLKALIRRAEAEKREMVPNCFTCAMPCGRTSDYDMETLWNAESEVRNEKCLILLGIRSIAAYAAAGFYDAQVDRFFYKALFAIGMDQWGREELLPIITELGEVAHKCMTAPGQHNNR